MSIGIRPQCPCASCIKLGLEMNLTPGAHRSGLAQKFDMHFDPNPQLERYYYNKTMWIYRE